MLFVDNGTTPILYVGKLAQIFNGSITVYDRDASGTEQSAHASYGFDGWNAGPAFMVTAKPPPTGSKGGGNTNPYGFFAGSCDQMNCTEISPILTMNRSDGYSVGQFTFQGVRVTTTSHRSGSPQTPTPAT